ncbi:hypothetical protein E5F05_01450 (plasmid) [Deinococcus metallilatus]|uniref:Cytochrome c domain-containing protein n=1 Tax=Deinococcus metallilatus TaxID=1211322 RepID=A0ABR6MNR3_9DEIO|nr:hypothetical protein [Deinococcus metallilatus]MBB5293579.1 hypothetical protein [Deinococcus metallilatus]QBY06646.1 hypothetical protein E5F05_01450 [Deinococcus metallilatus]RXJ17989.1 hypothetical protein ERJ73_01060 [Deinococcus metallilatus]GMA15201.1 hypothetical protein GCM10025871_15320 [Deinococcus metallilatus]
MHRLLLPARQVFVVLTGLLLAAGCGSAPGSADSPLGAQGVKPQAGNTDAAVPVPVVPEKELFVTDLSVVEDPLRTNYAPRQPARPAAGAWSFGRLMENLAGNQDPSAFTLNWLRSWETDQHVNGFTALARPTIRSLIIEPWLIASGCAPDAVKCQLDFSRAPFRLGSINTRLDLRQEDAQGKPLDAGEGRFIFFALNASGNVQGFSVIFEFRQVARNEDDVRLWAKAWHALGSLPFGETYNAALQNLTDIFSGRGLAPDRPNGSGLDQLRTNEAALALPGSDPLNLSSGKLWDMREFHLGTDGQLHLAPVAQTPDARFNGSPELDAWVKANAAAILAGQHQVPAQFLGASALTPTDLRWNVNGVDEATRRAFALATCSGCHLNENANETGFPFFLHVRRRAAGQASTLSAFLTQQELPLRAQDLRDILTKDKLPKGRGKGHVH